MCGGILFCVLFVFVLFGLLMAILPLMGVNIELLHLGAVYEENLLLQ